MHDITLNTPNCSFMCANILLNPFMRPIYPEK